MSAMDVPREKLTPVGKAGGTGDEQHDGEHPPSTFMARLHGRMR